MSDNTYDPRIHPHPDTYWGVEETEGYKVRELSEVVGKLRTPIGHELHVDDPDEPEGPDPEEEGDDDQ